MATRIVYVPKPKKRDPSKRLAPKVKPPFDPEAYGRAVEAFERMMEDARDAYHWAHGERKE